MENGEPSEQGKGVGREGEAGGDGELRRDERKQGVSEKVERLVVLNRGGSLCVGCGLSKGGTHDERGEGLTRARLGRLGFSEARKEREEVSFF